MLGSPYSSTEVLLSWGEIDVNDRNGVIIGYSVLYAKVTSNGSIILGEWKEKIQNQTNKVELLVDGLYFWTFYALKVAGQTKIGTGVYSTYIVVRTKQGSKCKKCYS